MPLLFWGMSECAHFHYNYKHFSEGVYWRDTRTKVNPVLLKPKLVKLYSPLLEEIAEEMVKRCFY
ncbi:unnamed protein product [Danaus chrysippus]|uniref:(African queen) hypothetical protein n=1 Tax=Danaus chrysippus TaxID=151541 RepID=A0A8J2W072_9NEOP|nr:unnamed protein product [Danaus chrysippus]